MDSSPSSSSSVNRRMKLRYPERAFLYNQQEGDQEALLQQIEKEHMFDKVVTPSDVGKLNRLVIPKQHAEKFFPLDSTTNEKGLLLTFEDRTGKPWRFRYSYWNSSQSYVMTKGWSRFVKEKRLDAGDTVSFGRGAGADAHDRLFIDWRRRAASSPMLNLLHRHHHHHLHHPSFIAAAIGHHFMAVPPPFLHYFPAPPPAATPTIGPVLESVPVVKASASVAKRVRLFGVNLDCPEPAAGYGEEGSAEASSRMMMMTMMQPPPSSSSSSSPLSINLFGSAHHHHHRLHHHHHHHHHHLQFEEVPPPVSEKKKQPSLDLGI